MTYYSVQSFRWTEREYTLKEIVEEYSQYLPFIIFVTEGYCSSRLEITADEIYWLHEITTQRCIVVKDDRNRYFKIPECLKEKIVPLKETSPGNFVTACKEITLSEFRNQGQYRYFRLFGTSTKEVFEGADEGKLMRIGKLEIVDVFEEKYLVGHPLLSHPANDLTVDMRLKRNQKFTGAIYPTVTLIPVYMPIFVAIAVCMNNKCDHKFFKAILELRKFANRCEHNYHELLESDAEIMIFNTTPVDKIYDYIEVAPILKGNSKRKPNEEDHYYSVPRYEASDSESDYLYPDDIEGFNAGNANKAEVDPLKYRYEPIARADEMCPRERLIMLKEIYETGILPPDTDPVEEPEPEVPPQCVDDGPKPTIPPRHRQQRHRSPPPTPGKKTGITTAKSRQRKQPPQVKPKSVNKTGQSIGDKEKWAPTSEKMQEVMSKKIMTVKKGSRNVDYTEQWTLIPEKMEEVKLGKTGNSKKGNKHRQDDLPSNTGRILPTAARRLPPETQHAVVKTSDIKKITCFDDIPSDISELSVPRVMECLHLLGLAQYVPALERSLVDGELLCCLTEDVLIDQFGFIKFDAKKLVHFCNGWRPKTD